MSDCESVTLTLSVIGCLVLSYVCLRRRPRHLRRQTSHQLATCGLPLGDVLIGCPKLGLRLSVPSEARNGQLLRRQAMLSWLAFSPSWHSAVALSLLDRFVDAYLGRPWDFCFSTWTCCRPGVLT